MKRRSPFELTAKDFDQWKQRFYLSRRQERLGQAFCNDHRLTHPAVYYEENPKDAEALIRATYVKELF